MKESNGNLRVSPTGAVKADVGKPQVSMLPRRGLEEISRVLTFGAKKYGRDNWRNGLEWSRVLDAAGRHILAYQNGEDMDDESGLSHLAHAGCCLLFLLEYEQSHPELDDRPKTGNTPQSGIPLSVFLNGLGGNAVCHPDDGGDASAEFVPDGSNRNNGGYH